MLFIKNIRQLCNNCVILNAIPGPAIKAERLKYIKEALLIIPGIYMDKK